MKDQSIILKEGREKPLWNHHPWIFSGAIEKFPNSFINGEIYPVVSSVGELLGHGYFNQKTSLSGRMISFGDKDPLLALEESVKRAIELRHALFNHTQTNAYRLINAEGDFLPGLIVDRYGDILVVQIGTLGMEHLKPKILEWLQSKIQVSGIYERSETHSRKEEGLSLQKGLLWGNVPEEIVIKEEGLSFLVSVQEGQKTGFFLDQREMRKSVASFSSQKKVLNAFGYTGAFSLYALKGGACLVDTVDSSESALHLAERNVQLNSFPQEKARFIKDDLFFFLNKCEETYDLIILDPPAFAKRREDLKTALKGYREINRLAMGRLAPGGILLTASCSYHVDEFSFQGAVLRGACEARREAKILSRHRLAPDHPIALAHGEGSYLKSLLLQVY